MGDFEFVVIDGPLRGQSLAFPGPRFFVGSSAECQVRLESGQVRPKHAEVLVDPNGVPWMRVVPGGKLSFDGESKAEGMLSDGCLLRLGDVELRVRLRGRNNPSGTMATPTPMRSLGGPRGPATGSTRIKASGPVALDSTAKQPTPFVQTGGPKQAVPDETLRSAGGLTPGTVIDGRYHITRKLAAGGMGEVYRAEHVELGKAFALKVMLPELSRDPEFVSRFKREAIAASRIGQQNIVDISDFGQTADGRFYFVMEFLDGLTLASLIHREGALDPERATNIGLQVARALSAAHAQSIVHRDLKPENIMLLQRPGQPDFVKVLDFGVAKVTGGHGQGGQTAIGMVVGTPQYMSPEQAKAIVVDARSDIYSFGLILYELISGRPTFSGETPSILMVKHVTELPPPLLPLEGLPLELEELVFKMLQKEPEDRPQTMEEVVHCLDTLLARLKAGDPTLERSTGGEAPAPPSGVSGIAVRVSGGQRAVSSTGGRAHAVTGAVSRRSPRGNSNVIVAPDEPIEAPKSKAPIFLGLAFAAVAAAAVGFFVLKGGDSADRTPPPPPTPVAQKLPPPDPEVKRAPADPVPVPAPVHVADKPPVPSDEPERATLKITTVPTGAEVMEGDVLLGQTPLPLTRKRDAVADLTFNLKGYVTLKRKVGFSASEVTIELEKKKEGHPGLKKPADLPGNPYPDEIKEDPYK
jgi:serine/threonine-protein kinase